MKDFEPFYDLDKINEEMARDLHEAIRAYRDAVDDLAGARKPSIRKARQVIETQREAEEVVTAIKECIFTVPVMVHVAEAPKEEAHPENPDLTGIVQRCNRCKSILHYWHEHLMVLTPAGPQPLSYDDIPWWEEGSIVAKYSGASGISMYEITPDHKLERHEMECVGIPHMG